ncbi:hypothetical protein P8C59_000532 [Phyllachora maydis]|uniref:Uncharacterized protein n=1 Tax=Phyllachora maydis TaxID=1825666 RepID=A0AAD9HWA7_9PEZI|nr:hypothetical protein P8C59_000532 [Phyllachora maydis]
MLVRSISYKRIKGVAVLIISIYIGVAAYAPIGYIIVSNLLITTSTADTTTIVTATTTAIIVATATATSADLEQGNPMPYSSSSKYILAISLLNNTGMFWVGEATTESFLYRNVCLCYINHDDDNGVHAHDWEAGWAANYIAHRNSFVPNGENCCGDAAMWCAGHAIHGKHKIYFRVIRDGLSCGQ